MRHQFFINAGVIVMELGFTSLDLKDFLAAMKKSRLEIDDCLATIKKSNLAINDILEDFAINSINAIASSANELPSCLDAIDSIESFLSHRFETVRNFACKIICSLIERAALLLCHETDPNKIVSAIKFLSHIIKELSSLHGQGSITITSESSLNINHAQLSMAAKIKQLSEKDQDKFISFT